MACTGGMEKEWKQALSPTWQQTEGFHDGGGKEGKRVALCLSGYLLVLCCKLVRVRMHHGPMGRSMDDGDGWVDG